MVRLPRSAVWGLAVCGVALAIAALANGRVGAPTAWEQSALRAAPAPAVDAPFTLRVVTWNIAAAYLFTGNRAERMDAIGARLAALDPDLVGLQEAFVASDRARLRRALAGTRLRHEVRFPGATVGNGLWILSAHPIEESWFHRYRSSGPWYRLWEGDWWAGKGVGLARIRLPGGALLDFFDTHAQAGRGNPENEVHRLGQMKELAHFVRDARVPGAPALVVGDFNTRPGRPDYELAVRGASLVRTMDLPSEIDHVFAVRTPRWRYEVVETAELTGTTLGSGPEFFLSRAPSPLEWLRAAFGAPAETRLSDHPGYAVTLRISQDTALDAPLRPR